MNQDTFSGGIQQRFDATKTDISQYRAALNCRIRKNVIEPSYKHLKLSSPSGRKQAIFALDDKLILVVAGDIYNLATGGFQRVGATGLSTTASVVYHENVPQPTNFLVGPAQQYRSVVSTTPLVAVLQDGVTQPALLSSALGLRTAKTWEQWSYDDPEYVPVGTLMAFSGNKLFIASPDRLREYQSVSGRPLDFMLLFDNITGAPKANADTTSLAVSTAPLTALVAAQTGGFIGGTAYKMHAAIPNEVVTVYAEPYLRPTELFPVGVIEQNAFALVNGETVFATATGFMTFNQVTQSKWESNMSPFGAPISELLELPLQRAVFLTVDDYVFFACRTKFGDGILVFDMQTGVFAGMDVTAGAVKEFALLKQNGLSRVFYITTADEVYEIPLFSGTKATASIYFGEWIPASREGKQTPGVRHKFEGVKLGLTNIKTGGYLTARPFCDRVEGDSKVLTLPAAATPLLNETGDFPFAGEYPSSVAAFDFCEQPNGYALGLIVDIAADCRIASLEVQTTTLSSDYPVPASLTEPLEYLVIGNLLSAGRYTADFNATLGRTYWAEATGSTSGKLLTGSHALSMRAGGHVAQNFLAEADRIRIESGLAVYDLYALYAQLRDRYDGAFVLGCNETTDKYAAVFQMFADTGKPVYAAANDLVQGTTARAQDFFGHSGQPRYYLVETRDVDYYCLSFPLTSGAPAELMATGEYATWLRNMITLRAANSPRRINVVMTPISPADNATFRAWNFARFGVHAVITAGSGTYRNTRDNGVLEMDIGAAGAQLVIQSSPCHLRLTYTDANGNRDLESVIV